ncbi:MAG: DedA family protein [Proteobacteria bacterium]|jgi:membrane-associated protein|nr:DedA family protein [Pseudomonadota bacterium]
MHFLDLILHLDKYFAIAIANYHTYIYMIIFVVIFCETGLVVTPFLPGDSLLFIAGSLTVSGHMSIYILAMTIFLAAFCGDNCNFFVGKFIGDKLFKNPNSKIFRQDILKKTHDFYAKNGRMTVVIARFVPLIRTFAPFVAGLGHMQYKKFIGFSILGSFLWVSIFLGGGYLFGNIPVIKSHISVIIIVIMIISIIPVIKMILDEIKQGRGNK